MNNKIRNILMGGVISASIATPTLAGDYTQPIVQPQAESTDMFSFSAGYHSDYIWRGLDLGNDLVDWSLEASTTVGCFDLTAGVWAARYDRGGEEIDFYAGVSKDLSFATVELGYIFYYFDVDTSDNTQEVYLSLSKEMAGIDFSATYYYDFDEFEEGYTELGAEKSFSLGGLGDLDAALAIGLDDDLEFTHAQVTVAKSFDLNSAVSLTPYLSYSFAIDDDTRDNQFVAGASIGFSF